MCDYITPKHVIHQCIDIAILQYYNCCCTCFILFIITIMFLVYITFIIFFVCLSRQWQSVYYHASGTNMYSFLDKICTLMIYFVHYQIGMTFYSSEYMER